MPSLGQELKQAREERGISLREISEATHIGVRFLQAIENDTYDQLPGGIFNRSFVLKYAHHIGLDEGQVSARYDQLMAEKGGESQKVGVSYLEDFEEGSSSSRFWLPALIFMILCVGAYAAYQYSITTGESATAPLTPPPSATPTPTPTPSPSPTPTPEASPSPSPKATTTVVKGLHLRVTASNGNCRMQVITDEKEPQTKLLRDGEAIDFVASDKLVLNLSNLLAVDVELNGRPAKLEPNLGKRKVRNVVITRKNYRQFLQ